MTDGLENSWELGPCSSSGTYGDNQEYTEQCCLAPGIYTLSCKDSYGDGWHGAFIKISGLNYCQDFLDGDLENVQITIGGMITLFQ